MDGLTLEDLLQVAVRVVGPDVVVRDPGLLVAAVARVSAVSDGVDVYPAPVEKAAALLQSLALTGPLDSGNRPFALAAALALLGLLGEPAGIAPDAAVDLVTDIVTGRVESVEEIAAALRG
ncbi:type II toxin-antitoxin system death-on-curing family toxin [Klenkia sp. LSe6-5]|uniref:Type II toxin-antitoxin system death-on-curing family toxin n=1 Tax=Klenkia sesuvii TaxID=3103137 RepID=A0ABU8DYF1_9ACTN